ncbi:MAG: substrate-binding domain-containing protein [Actinomycetota bacterium]
MFGHPKDRRTRTGELSRREFLRRAAAAGIALPSAAAILAACGDEGTTPSGGGPSGDEPFPLARKDNPVTLPLYDDNPAIADGLEPEAGPLKIFGYSEYIWKKIRNRFEDETGAAVEYTVFDTPEEMIAKIRSGAADFDLIVTVTLDNISKLAYSKLVQPLNHSYLPNVTDNVWASLQDPYYDTGSRYTIPYVIYSTGIGWRNDFVKTDIANMDNPYEIFWDTKYKGKTHVQNGTRDLIAMGLLKNGITDVNTADTADLDTVKNDLLAGAESMGWKFDHTDYTDLPDGSAWLHSSWSGNMAYAQYYMPKDVSIESISYVWPPDAPPAAPGVVQNDVFMIPASSKNPVLAHTMVNMLSDTETAIENYSYEGFQPTIDGVTPDRILRDELVPENLSSILLTESAVIDGLPILELEPSVDQLYQQIYQEVSGGA